MTALESQIHSIKKKKKENSSFYPVSVTPELYLTLSLSISFNLPIYNGGLVFLFSLLDC